MKYIDLSYDIEDKMSVHPYDSQVNVIQDKFFNDDKYNNYKLEMGTHVGTHIDSPMHMSEDKNFIGDYKLDKFCGTAKVFDVRGINNIFPDDFNIDSIEEDDIVLFYTGFEEKYGTEDYYLKHPTLDIGVGKILIEKGIKLVGMDMPSPDKYPFEVHRLLFSKGIFIVENLRNLKLLIGCKNPEVFMFPLKIKADASFIRGVAKI